jgi:hypothetical protein
MTSRLSEMRSLMISPAESTANLSLAPSTNLSIMSTATATSNASTNSSSSIIMGTGSGGGGQPQMMQTIMQAPRESRSAEALCSACAEVNGVPAGNCGQMWMSSDSSSSRCDLDAFGDNTSLVHCPDENIMKVQHQQQLSPARHNINPLAGQPLQIAKPLPSAMERCLSCMSKLGQQGQQDILSPSWTMDLNSLGSSAASGNNGGSNGNAGHPSSVPLPQGSIGSGNSDRLSISSHGSGSGGGGGGGNGGGEFYGNYDTPRSVLVAEQMRRTSNGRNTPPGHFQQGGGGNGCHFNNTGHQGQSSPYRRPCNNPGGGNNVMGCGGNCHCRQSVGVNNSHIYYNSVAEQQLSSKAMKGAPGAGGINHHAVAGGPYENYDFPRCVQSQPAQPHSLNSYPSYPGESLGGGNSSSSSVCVGGGGASSIDWTKVREKSSFSFIAVYLLVWQPHNTCNCRRS